MAAVQPAGLHCRDEELGAVGVRPGIRHAQHTWAGVLELEVLVRELGPVDALATSAVTACEVAALNHEIRDDAMELRALVVQGLARLTHALVTCAEGDKVGHRLRDIVAEEADGDALGLGIANLDVKEALVGDLGVLGSGQAHGAQQKPSGETLHRRHYLAKSRRTNTLAM